MPTANLIAFHGDAQLKNDMLAELALHREQDQIIKGEYDNKKSGAAFKGCAVGCSIHSLNVKRGLKLKTSDHGYISGWPERFMAAIKPGADLSMVVSQFMLWMLVDPEDGVIKFAKRPATKTAIEGVAELYRRKLTGQEIKREEWIKARQAAYAARQKHWQRMADKLIELLEAA